MDGSSKKTKSKSKGSSSKSKGSSKRSKSRKKERAAQRYEQDAGQPSGPARSKKEAEGGDGADGKRCACCCCCRKKSPPPKARTDNKESCCKRFLSLFGYEDRKKVDDFVVFDEDDASMERSLLWPDDASRPPAEEYLKFAPDHEAGLADSASNRALPDPPKDRMDY